MSDTALAKVERQESLPAVSAETEAIMQMIEQIALNPDADVEKLRAVMDMKMEMFNRGAEIEFNAAMSSAQAEMEPVARTAHNQQTDSNYAKLENIISQLSPIWTKHGFALMFGTEDSQKENHYRVTCQVSHRAGHSKSYHADLPADASGIKGTVNKTGIHAFGSTMSYGRRYLTCMIFNIALSGEDNDGNKGEKPLPPAKQPITPEMLKNLRNALKMADVSEQRLCKRADIERIEDLQQGRLKGCMEWLRSVSHGEAK